MNIPLNIDWQQIILHLLNFVILFGVLYFLLYNPVKNFMQQRENHYKDMDDEANKNLAEAKSAKEEYIQKLNSIDEEIEAKRLEAYHAISENTEQSTLLAKKEAEKIIADARLKAENDRKKVLDKAKKEIAGMVISAAEKIALSSNTSNSYDEFLADVERGKENE